MKEQIDCLWIQDTLDTMSEECIKSWIAVGYDVNLHTYSVSDFFSTLKINILDANDVIPRNDSIDIKSFQSDHWRFNLFKKNQESENKRKIIWLDTDIFLIRKIPTNIINKTSSQYNNKTGYYKSQKNYKANIGAMIFDGNEDIDWNKILTTKNKCTAFESHYLKNWESIITEDYVLPPVAFCPIHWAWAKDLFTQRNFKTDTKYGITQMYYDDIVNEDYIYGVHLWRSILRVKGWIVSKDCIYKQLTKLHTEK